MIAKIDKIQHTLNLLEDFMMMLHHDESISESQMG